MRTINETKLTGCNRRVFLRGIAAGLGTLVLPIPLYGVAASGKFENIATRPIPSTGERIPTVGLGSWITFNVGKDAGLLAESTAVIQAFFAAGGRMIDSSPMYGSAQFTIGHALQQLGAEEQVFATDKVWTGSVRDGPEQIEQSRKFWTVGKFDLLQIHNLLAWQGHLETLLEMKAEGRVRYIGITTSHGRRHRELEKIMRDYPIDTVQLTYNPVDREVEDRLLPLALEKGIAVIVNRPFQRGHLVDRLSSRALPAEAKEVGASSWAQLVLKFILGHPAVTCAIPATTQVAHVLENIDAGQGALPDKAIRKRIVNAIQVA